MFSPQIQGYHRLAGNQICGSSESVGKTLRSWSQCASGFWRLPLPMKRLRIKHGLVTGNLSLRGRVRLLPNPDQNKRVAGPKRSGFGGSLTLPGHRWVPSPGPTFTWMTLAILVCWPVRALNGASPPPARTALVRAVDLEVNEAQEVELADRTRARVKLLAVDETRDALRDAVRQAQVKIELNGQTLVLTSATYHLPVKFAGVQIDCPITQGYVGNSSEGNAWGLVKAARLRLWPAGSPWIEPGTFVYPLKQRWFASHTQMANEPTFVDGGEVPGAKKIYYHYGLDSGGAEGLVEVVAAAAGRVISAGKEILPGYDDSPAKARYDVVYLLDERGWYHRYSHLQTIDSAVRPGAQIGLRQRIGVLGKEGGSGGWSHLPYDITSRQPSGQWGIQEGYAFLWEAYQRQYAPNIVAVARPHHLVFTGEKVV